LVAAANVAFADSAAVDSANASTVRRNELPSSPVAGLTTATAAGPVQLVLPAGLGEAVSTRDGVVVYPDDGAALDMLAERTDSGIRTVARILSAQGVRMVTTFVRTPADTVMLAHTNGYLTINRITPAAETVGLFAPAETRDSAGKLVPSSYVVRQIRTGLYQLSEVIDPTPDTVWPVYVDPPLKTAGPGGTSLPRFGFSDLTGAISSSANAVGDAVSTAVSATVSGAQAVGTFVKNNPLETAIIVAGAAVAVTGVGGPAGAAAIAAAVANVGAAGLQVAAEAMPDNQTLGVMSTIANAATMITPGGAGKKIAEEGAELAEKLLTTHADEIIDVAKTAPTPPAQLSEEITAAAATPKAPLAETPKAANAPPAASTVKGYQPETLPSCSKLGCGHTTEHPSAVYSETEMPGHYEHKTATAPPSMTKEALDRVGQNRTDNLRGIPTKPGLHRDESPPATSVESRDGQSSVEHLPADESRKESKLLYALFRRYGVKPGDRFQFTYRGADDVVRCQSCANARLQDQRQAQESGDRQREAARENARLANKTGGREGGANGSQRSGNSSRHRESNKKPKKKKSSQHHRKPSGK
jgi:hypothetical protein